MSFAQGGKILTAFWRLLISPYTDRVVSDGERFDPKIARLLRLGDRCHQRRYFFARDYVFKKTVLDLGCGTGYGSALLAEVASKVHGLDSSSAAIFYAQKNYKRENVKFIQGDFFANNIVADIVVCFETLEHLKVESLGRPLKVLVSAARYIVIGSVPYLEKTGSNEHHRLFNLSETDFRYLEEAGELVFFYQSPAGGITQDRRALSEIQNLIFVLRKG